MLDLDSLKEYGADVEKGLGICMNNKDFYFTLVKMIPQEKNFDALKKAVEENDMKGAFEAAHALKGVTGNLALTPLFDALAEITELLRPLEETDCSEALNKILEEKEKLEEIING